MDTARRAEAAARRAEEGLRDEVRELGERHMASMQRLREDHAETLRTAVAEARAQSRAEARAEALIDAEKGLKAHLEIANADARAAAIAEGAAAAAEAAERIAALETAATRARALQVRAV